MSAFTFDTSGVVYGVFPTPAGTGAARYVAWPDVSLFVQGYLTAQAQTLFERLLREGWHFEAAQRAVAFRNWSPSALARALEDCEAFIGKHPERASAGCGRLLWESRQAGRLPNFPPLRISLSDDGKVETRGRDSAVADIALTPKRSSTEALPVGKED